MQIEHVRCDLKCTCKSVFLSHHIQFPCMYPQGDLHDLMERKGRLDAGTAIRFALDIARFFPKHHLPLSMVSEWLSLHRF